MTVAAVIVPADVAEATFDTAGRPAIRRIVDSAWSGGALPIIVVADDVDGLIAAALAGSPAVLSARSHGADSSPYLDGIVAAEEAVQGTSAALLWPGRMVWVDPETVTSLIEAHGRRQEDVARPELEGTPGWPLLVPLTAEAGPVKDRFRDIEADTSPLTEQASVFALGDPGSVIGREASLEDLPDYQGPGEPVGGPPPEWGAAAAETPDPETGD